uniref:GB1/RHD3-type G domain-containing protein n=1 Tax=Sphenodon punctatus TaxID=8508 RepID=A0A8D0HHR3_SPHPU
HTHPQMILMEEPVCLVGNGADGELEVNPVALKILGGINQPLVVVAIVGLYRTGKSYLMNSLAGKRKGFSLGATVQSHTKGIWMWCVPHPRSPGHTLVLLDTEGLGDVEKGSTKNDHWIFALAVLLSSTLVYNSKGTIDQYAMEQLQYPFGGQGKEATGLIAAPPSAGVSKKVQDYNLPRQCLRNFFPTRKCFIFVQPVSRQDISQLESLPESSLDPQFLDQTRKFCQYTFQESQPKTLKGGYRVNGRSISLVQSYVETILSGKVPCLENAVTSMAAIENEAAVKEALGHYMTEMEKLRLPMEQKELSEVHWKCEEKALQVLMQRSFKDEEQKYQKELVVRE